MLSKLKVASFYGKRTWENCKFWEDCAGKMLPALLGDCSFFEMDIYESSHNEAKWKTTSSGYDIAYWDYGSFRQHGLLYTKKPAKFVYSLLTDPNTHVEEFVTLCKPDFIGCLQTVPQRLVEICYKNNCHIEYFPWWHRDWKVFSKERDILAFCSGNINQAYPKRIEIVNYLKKLTQPDIVVSCNDVYGKYPLDIFEYYLTLSKSKFYFTAGVRDLEPPEKIFEACFYGCCLVSNYMPLLESCGFVDGVSYIKLNSIEEIPDILKRTDYEKIATNGKNLIIQRHNAYERANRIKQIYKERYDERMV